MKIRQLMPILYTKELERTGAFYQSLGFRESNASDTWIILAMDETSIMISLPNQHQPFDKPTFTGSFYFEVDKVDELWEALKNKARVCYSPEDFEYGMREFAIYDNNGFLLQFGQEINQSA